MRTIFTRLDGSTWLPKCACATGSTDREHDHIASDLFNIHESDREMKPDVYVSKAAHVEGFPKSFEKIGRTISGQNRLSLTNIYYYVEKLNCIIVLI